MKILIVEDERPTAEDIQLFVTSMFNTEIPSIHIENSLDSALFIWKRSGLTFGS